MKVTNVEKGATKKIVAEVLNEDISKSAKMKKLFTLGLTVKEIANLMNVRYNFVYNVVSNFANVNGIEIVTDKKEGKKEKIVAMYLNGASNKEISIELKTNYNYVFNVIKSYKQQNESAVQ